LQYQIKEKRNHKGMLTVIYLYLMDNSQTHKDSSRQQEWQRNQNNKILPNHAWTTWM